MLLDADTGRAETGPVFGSAADLRGSLTAGWPQRGEELVAWLSSTDARYRSFAVHVLAHRQPLAPTLIARIRALQDNRDGQPWARVAATRCLVELGRERLARLDAARRHRAVEPAAGTIEANNRPQRSGNPASAASPGSPGDQPA